MPAISEDNCLAFFHGMYKGTVGVFTVSMTTSTRLGDNANISSTLGCRSLKLEPYDVYTAVTADVKGPSPQSKGEEYARFHAPKLPTLRSKQQQ